MARPDQASCCQTHGKRMIRINSVLLLLISLLPLNLAAATIVVNNINGPGVGFNDTTPVSPVAGNPATTLGAQRLAAFQAAADEWAAMLVSPVTIRINAEMISLSCSQNSATLGSAGPAGFVVRDFANAPAANTWFPQALANSLTGQDEDPSNPDISARFNKDVGTPGCLESLPWSYVIGTSAPPNTLPFTDTVIHEIGHGLGFLSFVNSATGEMLSGRPDHYSRFLMDETPTPTLWPALSNAGRAASATDTGNLTWSGQQVGNVAGLLSAGRHASSNRVRMYAPAQLSSGSSVSHWDTALTPNEIMEPSLQLSNEKRLTNHLMLDIGWHEQLALALDITDGLDDIAAGSGTSYTITLANQGAADITVVNATLSNVLPAALQSVSWSCGGSGGASCGSANGNGAFSVNVSVPLGGVITMAVNATVDPGFEGQLSHQVDLGLPAQLSNTESSTATDTTTVDSGLPPGGVTVSAVTGTVTEAGGSASFTVVLDNAPEASVMLGISSSDLTEATVAPSSLMFTDANWSTPQQVTVSGVDDDIDDGDTPFNVIIAAASSADARYAGLDPDDVPLVNLDDDMAGISLSAISGDTTEAGGVASFSVVLLSEPLHNVSVAVATDDASEGLAGPSPVVFTSSDWDTPQWVDVTGVDDDVDDGDVAYTIVSSPAVSADASYNGLDAADVAVINLDDDTAALIVSAASGPTSEDGGTATFTVRLASQPTASVTLPVSSNDPTEGSASPASLQFGPGDWNQAQTVTVTGLDDGIEDGDVAYSVSVGPGSSSDPKYQGLAAPDVQLVNYRGALFRDGFE